jgi:hypothetical protein
MAARWWRWWWLLSSVVSYFFSLLLVNTLLSTLFSNCLFKQLEEQCCYMHTLLPEFGPKRHCFRSPCNADHALFQRDVSLAVQAVIQILNAPTLFSSILSHKKKKSPPLFKCSCYFYIWLRYSYGLSILVRILIPGVSLYAKENFVAGMLLLQKWNVTLPTVKTTHIYFLYAYIFI